MLPNMNRVHEASTVRCDIPVTGMTCASCAARVERKLNRIEGVTASVNFATASAHVALPPTVGVPDVVAALEATG